MPTSSIPAVHFPGKVIIMDAKQSMDDARRARPISGQLEVWTDMSMTEEGREIGLAAAWMRPDSKYWREATKQITANIRGHVSELYAIKLGIEQAGRLLQPDDKELIIRSDGRQSLKFLKQHEAGDYVCLDDQPAHEQCNQIHDLVSKIQGGQTWEQAKVKVTLIWVKAHAHIKRRGGDGGAMIMGNCWADWWASVAKDGGKVRERPSEQGWEKIRALVEERRKYDESGQEDDDVLKAIYDEMEAAGEPVVGLDQPVPQPEGKGEEGEDAEDK